MSGTKSEYSSRLPLLKLTAKGESRMARNTSLQLVVCLATLGCFARVGLAVQAEETSLTGKWSCDDEGTYYLRQVGKTVWWMGKSKNDGQAWTNGFRGTLKDNVVTGDWADVP